MQDEYYQAKNSRWMFHCKSGVEINVESQWNMKNSENNLRWMIVYQKQEKKVSLLCLFKAPVNIDEAKECLNRIEINEYVGYLSSGEDERIDESWDMRVAEARNTPQSKEYGTIERSYGEWLMRNPDKYCSSRRDLYSHISRDMVVTNEKPDVLWIYGPTNTGKTKIATMIIKTLMDRNSKISCFRVVPPNNLNPARNYMGQKIAFFDDITPSKSLTYFLRQALEPNFPSFNPKLIIITSRISPDEWCSDGSMSYRVNYTAFSPYKKEDFPDYIPFDDLEL